MSAPEQQTSTVPTAPAVPESARPQQQQQSQPQQQVEVDDNLTCKWDQCNEHCDSAEILYDHICERHVGRKSTNNLNLTCGWNLCRTTTVKRDHITSHIRVHVPLKPHQCSVCPKNFKRPQDLKKHLKTHADESVLLQPPNQNSAAGPSYRTQSGKAADLQNLAATAATASSFYNQSDQMHQGPNSNYGQSHHGGHGGHGGYYAHQPQYPSGSPVYYNVPPGNEMGHQAAMYDERKRGHEALNNFFGQVKGRGFEPTSYPQVGQRLTALNNAVQGSTMLEYMPAPSLVGVGGHGSGSGTTLNHSQYGLPIPNLRTKSDLLHADAFLEEMQATVYENPTTAAAAGVHQPGNHYTHNSVNFHQTHSPSGSAMQNTFSSGGLQVSAPTATAPLISATSSHSPRTGTPALTPPSSTLSYTSGHSPISVPGLSPSSRHSSSGTVSYPTLPAVSGGYSAQSNGAPVPTLGPSFDHDHRPRYGGGMLQRSAGSPVTDDTEVTSMNESHPSEGNRPPINRSIYTRGATREESTDSLIDPALEEQSEETWVAHMRLMEAVRKFVRDRIELEQWDDADDVQMANGDKREERLKSTGRGGGDDNSADGDSLYPVLKTDTV